MGSLQYHDLDVRPGHRIGLYGPGGVGKTTLAACAPGPVVFLDLDMSLPVLRPELGPIDVRSVRGVDTWEAMLALLRGDGWADVKTIVVDTATRAEEMCAAWVIRNVPHEKDGVKIRRVEDYGWGKGYQHIYETFIEFLMALEAHTSNGRNVVLVSHECTATVPNPIGADYMRFEPRLQSPASGKGSIRLRVREWCDHLIFLGFDVSTNADGKASGKGSRTAYVIETPWAMAKTRGGLNRPVVIDRMDDGFWTQLLGAQ